MGQAPAGDTYNTGGDGWPLIAGAGDFSGLVPRAKKFTTKPTKLCSAGDTILSIRASIGARVVSDGEYCLGRGVAGIRADESKLDNRYLWHWLDVARAPLAAKGRGATFLQVSKADVAELIIPLPPLPEQRRIAAILDQADELRTQRRRAMALIDGLADSFFAKLGAADDAPLSLGEAGVNFSSGKSVVGADARAHPRNRVLKVNAVSSGYFNPGQSKPMPDSYAPPRTHEVRRGDLLFTRASGSVDLIGISAFVDSDPEDLYLPDKLWRAVFHEDSVLIPEYLHQVFKQPSFRAHIQNESSGAAGVRNISQKSVLRFGLQIPPVEVQIRFSRAFNKLQELKAVQQGHLDRLEELFTSLQRRAFVGEL